MTLRFWKDGEKFTERELDSYWNGREEEQDRIIELLQKRINNHRESGLPEDGFCACGIYEYTIALIKGEEE